MKWKVLSLSPSLLARSESELPFGGGAFVVCLSASLPFSLPGRSAAKSVRAREPGPSPG